MIDASTQTDPDATATGISCDSYSRAEIAKKAVITASTQTDEDAGVGSSRGTPSPLATLVNTPADQSSQVDAEDSELQDAVDGQEVVLEGQNEEEQMQEPSPFGDETTLEQEQRRTDPEQTQEEAGVVREPLEARAHPEDEETGAAQIAEAAGALQELALATSTPMIEEALLDTEKAAHEQTRSELAQLRADITGKDVELRRSGRRLREANASCEQLREENNYLLTQLDEADALISDNDDLQIQLDDAYEQISNFEVANGEQSDQIAALQQQVDYLSDDAGQMREMIRTGGKELKFFVQLGVQLYNRLNRAEGLLEGALGRSDRLMRSAAQRLSVYTPVDLYFRDAVVEEEEPTVQLATEGAAANLPAMDQAETGSRYEVMTDDADLEQLVNEIFEAQHGTAVANGDVVDDEAEEEIQDTEPVLSSMAPIATSSGAEPLFQPTASPVEDEGYRGGEHNINGTAGPRLGNHETTRDQTPSNQANASRPDAGAQNPIFGASARIFGARVSAYPVPNGDTESGSFNFATATDFNFGATTSFQAGSGSVKGGSKGCDVTDQEEPKEGPSKKTGTASIFEAAAGVDPSPSSADKKEEKANKKKKTPSIFEAAAAPSSSSGSRDEAAKKTKITPIFDLSALSSNDMTEPGASFDRGPKGASEIPKFAFTGSFDFSKTEAKDEQGKEPAPVFGAGKSKKFSFSPSGSTRTFGGFNGDSVGASTAPSDPVPFQFKGKGKQKEESRKEAANAPIFTAEAMARFDSPAPSKKAGFDRFDLGSVGASKGQPEASSSSLTSGRSAVENSVEEVVRDLEDDHDDLYGYEEGYEPPQKRLMPIEQAEMEPASATNSADAIEGDTMSSKPTQGFLGTLPEQLSDLSASSDSSRPVQSASTATPNTSTFGRDVASREQGSNGVDGGNPVDDVAGVSRIGNMPAFTREGGVEAPPAAQENAVGDDLSENPASRRVNSASHTAANEVRGGIWQSYSGTAEEIIASWKAECRERAGPPTASTPWREAERPATLPPLATPRATSTSTHSPAASTQAVVNDLGPNHGIEEEIDSVMGAIEILSLGTSAPRAKMSDLNTGIPFLSADWFARRYSYSLRATIPQRQVDGIIEQEVQTEGASPTRMEDSRVSEDEQTPEQEPTISEQPQPQPQAETSNEEVPIPIPIPIPMAQANAHEPTEPQQNTLELVSVLSPCSAPPTTRTNDVLQSQSQSQQSDSQVSASTATGQESWGRSKYGTPRDKKGGWKLWSLRTGRR